MTVHCIITDFNVGCMEGSVGVWIEPEYFRIRSLVPTFLPRKMQTTKISNVVPNLIQFEAVAQ